MEKQTLIKLSTRAWHYKFMAWALGSLSPTSSNMFNLCPYFWLLIFSLIASPLIVIVKFFKVLFVAIDSFIERKFMIPNAQGWYENLTKEDVTKMWYWNYSYGYSSKYLNRLDKTYDELLKEFYEKDTGKKLDSTDSSEFRNWANAIQQELRRIKALKKPKTKLSDKLVNFLSSKLDNIKEYISVWSAIIKWTKRFTGLVITVIGLFLTYFIVTFITKGTIWLIANWDWTIVLYIVLGLLVVVLFVVIIGSCVEWIEYMKRKGTKLWYVKVLYYLIAIPIISVFYHFFWRFIVIQIIYGALKAFWRGFVSFLGIFGEYFGTSYTDYCPGIEWERE